MKKAFVVISESYNLASRFLPGVGDHDFYLSYAQEFPDLSHYDSECYWMSGGYAARMRRIGLAARLTAPGQDWLSGVDEKLTGREIVTGQVLDMPENVKLWAKPAEAKIDSVVAGMYTRAEVEKIAKEDNIPVETLFQWTTSILNINHEHRFFVAHRKIMTGSPYLIDKVVYHSSMFSPYYDEAYKAAEKTIAAVGDNQPPAYTLDMGRIEDTGQWIIIESNPAWSSGPYGCDSKAVIETLDVACNNPGSDWLWEPAEYLKQKALLRDPMKIVDINDATGVFLYNG